MPSNDTWLDAGAEFSPCRTYRYTLWRRWSEAPFCAFIMLNPSTADESVLDPTVRRCVGFARRWGYGGVIVGNLFALRSTSPSALYKAPVVGDDWRNNDHLERIQRQSDLVVAAWGNHGAYLGRGASVLQLLDKRRFQPVHYLRLTGLSHPGHPLYLPKTLKPIPFVRIIDETVPPGPEAPPPGLTVNTRPCGECRRYIELATTGGGHCVKTDQAISRTRRALAPVGAACFEEKVEEDHS